MNPVFNKINIISTASNIPVYTCCVIISDMLVLASIIIVNRTTYVIELRKFPNRCLTSKLISNASNRDSVSIIADNPAIAPK